MKKIWIASIFACIMLMVPITNVVGVNEVDEDSVRASPLFNVRSKRVIDEESRDLAYDYIGKDEDSNLYFPKRNSKIEIFDKIIYKIKQMDEKTFDMFVKKFISYVHKNNVGNLKISNLEIKELLYQIKNNPETIKNNFILMNKKDPPLPTFNFICILILIIFFWPILVLMAKHNILCEIFGGKYTTIFS